MKGDSMNEDLTKHNQDSESERLKLILTLVQKLQDYGPILAQIRNGVDALTSRIDAIEKRLDAIEKRLDILDTRLGVVESRLDSIEGRLQSLEKTVTRSVHHLDRGQSVLNDAILKINIGFLDFNERFQRLEPQQKLANSST
jgi:predicted  nucleic acid-binding Zn-ribbon protein